MSDFSPFPILKFATGLYDYLKPFIRPEDAFEPLINAYVYRGALTKRNGSTIFGNQLADQTPVMGIMQYVNESTGAIVLVVTSEKYLYSYTPGTEPDSGTFTQVTSVKDSPFYIGNIAVAAPPSFPTFWTNITPASVTIKHNTDSLTFDATGAQNSAAIGIFGVGSTFNFTTGIATIVFVGPFPLTNVKLTIDATVGTKPYFTGNITNFFSWCNWQPTSSITTISTSYLYMTNNIDPVTLFDGTNMARPGFYTDTAHSTYIQTALDVKTYANRLLLLLPTLSTNPTNAENQDIYYSAIFDPFNFINDIPGNGGSISAATGDRIMSAEFLRDNLIVAFSNSTWTFQITGQTTPPFIFRKLNATKSIQCPYAGIAYDERITNLGNTGFVACDGVNVQRCDIPIIDYYETQISQQFYNQDFALRYDNLNQTWMNYPSFGRDETDFPLVDSVAPGSDEVLIHNFLENTWATYTNSFPMTCLGSFYIPSGTTWAILKEPWETNFESWDSYGFQTSGRFLLGGDTSGNIYHLDDSEAVQDGEDNVYDEVIATGNGGKTYSGTITFFPIQPYTFIATDGTETFTDNGDGTLTGSLTGTGTIVYATGAWTLAFHNNVVLATPITSDYTKSGTSFEVGIRTTRWNPFMKTGQKTQFGYIDVFYSIDSTILYPVQVTLNFFVDNNGKAAASRPLTLDAPENSVNAEYAWKRIYCNLMGEFIQIEIDPSEDAPFQILGFVLWARPAGRFTGP